MRIIFFLNFNIKSKIKLSPIVHVNKIIYYAFLLE